MKRRNFLALLGLGAVCPKLPATAEFLKTTTAKPCQHDWRLENPNDDSWDPLNQEYHHAILPIKISKLNLVIGPIDNILACQPDLDRPCRLCGLTYSQFIKTTAQHLHLYKPNPSRPLGAITKSRPLNDILS